MATKEELKKVTQRYRKAVYGEEQKSKEKGRT